MFSSPAQAVSCRLVAFAVGRSGVQGFQISIGFMAFKAQLAQFQHEDDTQRAQPEGAEVSRLLKAPGRSGLLEEPGMAEEGRRACKETPRVCLSCRAEGQCPHPWGMSPLSDPLPMHRNSRKIHGSFFFFYNRFPRKQFFGRSQG